MQDCNNLKYDNELNERLNTRYFPSEMLKPVFDSRPVPTKYSHFQLFEEQKSTTVPLLKYKYYIYIFSIFSLYIICSIYCMLH